MAEAERLLLALKAIRPADWEAFERLCSAFLSEDFPELRTIAGVGDEGRDAVFHAADQPSVVVQYSLSVDWSAKIKGTLERLEAVGHPCSALVYVTSQEIGPRADALKRDLMSRPLLLDVRDRGYFVERVYQSDARMRAAEDLSRRVVDPLLPVDAVTRNSAIDNPDLRAGLLYLELHSQDVEQSRAISRVSIDALVLAALRETTADDQMTRDAIADRVAAALPGRDKTQVANAVDRSLAHLRDEKRVVFTQRADSFALHFSERSRRDAAALELVGRREEIRRELSGLSSRAADILEVPLVADSLDPYLDALEAVFERVLEERGNEFAEAVRAKTGRTMRSDVYGAAEDVITRNAGELRSMRVGRDVEFPRFRGHLMTERARSERMSVDAEGAAVFAGVQA